MWIQLKDKYRDSVGTTAFCSEAGTLGHRVELTATGKANVPKDVGEQVLSHYDCFERTDTESASTDETDDDSETTTETT